ncbi:outer membrane transport energization protein ExbB [Verrucomicrobium sp. GAS474]|uniref:MotA/TolQ/ExbB proton channel family protein n=1 Tax=Verrucomicrobium sp. GAS474 TaxID=1882831 RepID=UPI00087B438A|nr:MotA/TolQ/ExbB proton channel family protein [Verrucomicrobium sp. GAS474]SDT92410.1 outer membrane transport energization protein ExbB [Verrucomicrobium sp. GAS474]
MLIELFVKGGPIMWPILILSFVTVGVVVERILFLVKEARYRDLNEVRRIFSLVEHGRIDEAALELPANSDRIAIVLSQGLAHRDASLTEAMIEASQAELDRHNRGLVVLDTAVTLGPLLGLLGTVTGMMRAFNLVGGEDLAGKTAALTGGVSECLIAVTFGLGVAILALIPLNYLNARLEKVRREFESAMTRLELLVTRQQATAAARDGVGV